MSPKQSRMPIPHTLLCCCFIALLYKALKDTDLLFMFSDTVKQFLNSISMAYDLILCKDFRYL